MPDLLTVAGLVVAVVAAARSTWSPCGLSMLSTITPFGERGRGHRYGITAAWFIAGSTAGGLTLGVVAGGGAAVASALAASAHSVAVGVAATAAAGLATGIDAGLAGDRLPMVRRQVDEAWLSRYRPWVYGGGFGWQVGAGVVTYVMTTGVFLMVALAVLTGSPPAAIVICIAFGLARGLTVLATIWAPTPARLRALHAAIDRAGPAVRVTMIVVELATAVLVSVWALGPAGLGALVFLALVAWIRTRVLSGARPSS